MKSSLLVYALVACAGTLPSVALADTATLTISGRVLPGTCTLAAPPIALDPIKADELVVGDNGLKAGALNFTGCVGVSKAVLSFSGTAATGDAERWQNTASTDPAVGVSVALLAGATGTTYLKNGDTGIEVPVTGATASFPLRAGYYATALTGLQAGEVRSEITVTADYE